MRVAVGVVVLMFGLATVAQAEDAPDRAFWTDQFKGRTVDLSRLTDLDGNPFDLSAQGGSVLIHFWATWCGPCLEEMPKLIAMAKEMNSKIEIVAVSEDKGGADQVKPFLARHSELNSIKILLDQSRKGAKSLTVSVLPTTILVKNGIELDRVVGSAPWEKDDVRHLGDDIGN